MRFWNKKDDVSDEDEVSFKVKCKRFILKLLLTIAVGLIYTGIGLLITYLIASRYQYKPQDIAFTIGCLIVVLGIFMIMHGNPSGGSISSLGSRNAVAANYWLLETTLQERESTNYNKNFRKHAVIELTFNRFSFILGGIFLGAIGILFL
ncbi:MAG: hypothetical protein K0R34_1836 [Herbinix sp.]|nr:hypothetical protein [Herbinix sp.]